MTVNTPTRPDRGKGAPAPTDRRTVLLAGNPNVGKSTVFNALTGLRQHTGNWPGKTVSRAEGAFDHGGRSYHLIDLPGTYSLRAMSEDEAVARDAIAAGDYDAVVVVLDATALERNLALAVQVLARTPNAVLCVNLVDEAEAQGITVDTAKLSESLGVPAVATAALAGKGIDKLVEAVHELVERPAPPTPKLDGIDAASDDDEDIQDIYRLCERVVAGCVTHGPARRLGLTRAIDRVVTHPVLGLPLMLTLLGLVFYLTIAGANVPSAFLAGLLHEENGLTGFFAEVFGTTAPTWLQLSLYERLLSLMAAVGAPAWLTGLAVNGVYLTLAWVVSVMLPPMAIFFPMFTLLEDLGYLPRVAFNLDWLFRKFGAHGKQSLTMAMGFGCNAAGVISCRVINSPRERLIAILTNNFMICNGRFPTVILIAAVVIAPLIGRGAATLTAAMVVLAVVLMGLAFTLASSLVLSRTVLKGEASSFTLELPKYRRPAILRILHRSLIDRTLFVLWRACLVSIPAGVAIWVMSNLHVGGTTVGEHVTGWLEPVGGMMGLDGAILLAYIIAIPANEIIVPTILMLYTTHSRMIEPGHEQIASIFDAQGWTLMTAVCLLIFVVLHNPCGTTIYTIYKETGSKKWTALAALAPVVMGIAVCIAVAGVWRLVG